LYTSEKQATNRQCTGTDRHNMAVLLPAWSSKYTNFPVSIKRPFHRVYTSADMPGD